MATRAIEPVIVLPPPIAFALGVPMAPRSAVEAVIETMIAALDTIDGDDDIEPNGDELDGQRDEDAFMVHRGRGPGCPIADPDKAADDDPCDEPYQDIEPDEGT